MKRPTRLGFAALLAGALMAASAPAVLAGDDDIRRSGGCSKNATWKLKLSEEDGKIEVEYEVDQNVVGDKWRVRLFNDGNRFFRGKRTTKAPSGSFEVERLTGNGPGPDVIRGRARNLATDELCKGRATW